MMSLVAYESSDEGSDNEENIIETTETSSNQEIQEKQLNDDKIEIEEKIPELHTKLPAPKTSNDPITEVIEEDDEFLHKKEVPVPKNIKKGPVRIMIPSLSEFKDIEEKKEAPKVPTAPNKKSSLLGILPKPKTEKYAIQIPSTSSSSSSNSSAAGSSSKPMSTMIPHSVMNKKKPVPSATQKKPKNTQKTQDSESESDEEMGAGSSFFSFGADEKLPEVSINEINSLVAKKAAKMSEITRKLDEEEREAEQQQELEQEDQQEEDFDQTAIQALLGGNKAKRAKMDDIKIIDLSGQDVLPDRDEWQRKMLKGETEFIPTGNLVEKGPNALAKRKHQISYLAMRAMANEAELEAMWQANRQTKRESKSKYGF